MNLELIALLVLLHAHLSTMLAAWHAKLVIAENPIPALLLHLKFCHPCISIVLPLTLWIGSQYFPK